MKVVLRQIESGRIRRFGERLLARVGKHADEKSEIYSSLGVRLWQHFKRLFSAEPIRESGIAEMHKLRIRVKELRYQVEALSEVLPSGVAPPAVCLLETLQDRLGQVRDRAVSMHCLLEGMASSRDIRDIEKAWPALKTAHSGLVKSMLKLTRWWTGDRRDELRRAVREWVNGLDRPKAQGDV